MRIGAGLVAAAAACALLASAATADASAVLTGGAPSARTGGAPSAGPGYDLVTGVGTINAARFVPDLAGAATGSGGR